MMNNMAPNSENMLPAPDNSQERPEFSERPKQEICGSYTSLASSFTQNNMRLPIITNR